MAGPEFELKIVSPEGVFLNAKATLVEILTGAGQIGVMAGHERLMTTLEMGDLTVHQNGHREVFYTAGGFARIYPEFVLIMAMSIRRRIDNQEFEAFCHRVQELMVDSADAAQISTACELARQRLTQTHALAAGTEAAELAQGRIVGELKKKRRE